jgi:hypothetical protein
MRSQASTINPNKATISFVNPKSLTFSKEQLYFTVGVVGLIICFSLLAIVGYHAFLSTLA